MLEGPYKLPEGWRWVRLGEVAEVCYGKANPKKPGSVPVVGSSGVYDYTASPLISFPTVVVGRKGNAGEALLVKEPCWPSDTVFYLRWLVDISPEWVAAWLKVHKPSSEGTSPTLPSLRREELESHLIPLPPLSEQRRIVARIEALMARVREARRLRQAAREEAERLWQSVLADTFPRPGSPLPSGWRWVRLGEVALDIQTGFAFRKKNVQRGDILQLRPYNIGNDGELDLRQQFFVPIEALPSSWSPLEPGDVLFNNTNSVELIGKTALVREHMEVALSNHITRIRVRPDLCEGAWLALTLNALWRQGFFAQRCNRWIGQAGYNTESLRETPIPLPPLSEQRRIVAHLEAVQEKIRALRAVQAETEEELKRLEQAMLDKAFRGEL